MATNTIVILLPGTTATTLIDPANQQVAWGGTPSEVDEDALQGNVDAADALLEGQLNVGTLAGWVGQPTGYGVIQSLFANTYGFTTTRIASAADVPKNVSGLQLFGFAYDWRRDNTYTAGILQQVLQKIDSSFNASDTYQVWLLAHSMGGLVARALLEPNAGNSARWYQSIQGLITLGTPHLGAPLALEAILNQLSDNPLIPAYMDPVISKFVNYNGAQGLYDSTYELLPPPQRAFVNTPTGKESAFDSTVESAIISAGGSQLNFSGAQKFFATLSYSGATPRPYYCVYGSFLPTMIAYNYSGTTWTPGLPLLAGDGIVPADSAQFSGRTVAGTYEAVGVDHLALITDSGVLSHVVKWIGLSAAAEKSVA